MDAPSQRRAPVVKTGMLIHRSPAEVFNAFIDPGVTTRFWFTKSSGRLEPGKQVQWDWDMYGASADVTVKSIETNRRIVIEWPGENGQTTVEWRFIPFAGDSTFVQITEAGFTGDADSIVRQVADSTQGFTLVVAGLKALLEHGCELNLVRDRYPAGIDEALR